MSKPTGGKVGRPKVPPPEARCVGHARHRNNEQCLNYREGGTTVCRKHGARGIVARQTQVIQDGQGRRSMRLPAKLAERYQQLIDDPDILNLSRDLALLDLRLEELTGRLEDNESVSGWRRARDAFTKLREALTKGDGGAIREELGRLGQVITGATASDSTWRDIRDVLLERRLLAETERRRLVDLHQMVTVEELMLLMNAILIVINRHVPEPQRRLAIAMEIRSLMNRRAATQKGRAAPTPEPDVVDVRSTVVGRS